MYQLVGDWDRLRAHARDLDLGEVAGDELQLDADEASSPCERASTLGVLAYARRKAGNLRGARRLLEEVDPAGCEKCAAEHSWRSAELLRCEGSPEEALRVLESLPGDIAAVRGHLAEPADTLSTRAKVLWDLGRKEDAVRDFAASLELRDPESHLAEIGTYNLARAISGCGATGRKQARAYVRVLRQKLKHKSSPAVACPR